ncbi:hypothetical protein SAY86_030723 [Trapa natans]|uniref:Inositol polyphosphate-related phosphatase domain-containing protein n=1 Tax=Trapa natans TaxID=22666 RepID=A0AAN7MGG1_TRANT|nr:hypothetical protein SAY86_030723 [Trapa natans]
MRTETTNTISKVSWTKVVVRKWLNMRSRSDEYHSDCGIRDAARMEKRKSCSEQDRYAIVPEELSEGWLMEEEGGLKQSPVGWPASPSAAGTHNQHMRMFVGTWNVGGKAPHEGLNLRDWLPPPSSADIYVLGFQEIVPLNAGNVLGAEDDGPAAKWLSLIRRALNTDDKIGDYYTESQPDFVHPSLSFSQLFSLENGIDGEDSTTAPSPPASRRRRKEGFCLAASKQMVGLLLCVWVREGLQRHISSLKVSCVGRGIMGYLGNKGSISISMTLHRTAFCFVCTHLTSGEKEGDEHRRNSDVVEILRRTKFCSGSPRQPGAPDSIMAHDMIVWLGDLNYRLASSSSLETHELVRKKDWKALLEKDQLMIEQKAGRVFQGWQEGRIQFAPTYKYLFNSDCYVVHSSKSKERRRTPAWCDRILWKGEGMKQVSYLRGESRFSDHRPVYSLFSVQVHVSGYKDTAWFDTKPMGPAKSLTPLATSMVVPSTGNAKVQAEELLLTRAQSCIAYRTAVNRKPQQSLPQFV